LAQPCLSELVCSHEDFPTLVHVLTERARTMPQDTAFLFLSDRGRKEEALTFAQLHERAQTIAVYLSGLGEKGDRVLLFYPPGLEYIAAFMGCLYAGMTAAPLYPPRPNQKLDRVDKIIADCGSRIALTDEKTHRSIWPFLTESGLFEVDWIHTTDTLKPQEKTWPGPMVEPEDLAFLQYTSGSTGAPKGAMVSHGNLMANLRALAGESTAESVFVNWLPLYHDMGLINTVLHPIYRGCLSVLMPSMSFIQRPISWLHAIQKYRGTICGGPNFAFELCAKRITPEQLETLDLSSWVQAYNGAEPINPETMDRFSQAFAPAGFHKTVFYPCYGMAEATLIITGSNRQPKPVSPYFEKDALARNEAKPTDSARDAQRIVGCGRPLHGVTLRIVDPVSFKALPQGQVGEIWTSGPSVVQGYWNRPQKTAESFNAEVEGQGGFLRTGDLGFLWGDELFVTGRMKDLIIIRGRNHYPTDIENTAGKSHASLNPGAAAAFSIEVEGEERLVLVQEVARRETRKVNSAAVIEAIRTAIAAEHELQIHAVALAAPGAVPKTSSGKIQRSACREAWQSGELKLLHQDQLEEQAFQTSQALPDREMLLAAEDQLAVLTTYLEEVTAVALKTRNFTPDTPLTALGLDSMKAVEIQHQLENDLGVNLPIVAFLKGSCIAELAQDCLGRIEDQPQAEPQALVEPGPMPLSQNQRALWFLHQLAPDNSAYNVCAAVDIVSPLNEDRLQKAFHALVKRHPSLRTVFSHKGGEPHAEVLETGQTDLQWVDASSWRENEVTDYLDVEAHRPFHLEHGPLMRVRILKRGDGTHTLLLTLHHIITDFWSMLILADDLRFFYTSDAPPPQLSPLHQPATSHDTSWWEKELAGNLPALDLPTDFVRPRTQTFRGASHAFRLDESLTTAAKTLAMAEKTSLFTVLLATWQTLLSRYSGQDDILVGTPTMGRNVGNKQAAGYFVNPVVLRANPTGHPHFQRFLASVRESVLGALDHADTPFHQLVQKLQPERDPSRSPLCQSMFVLQKPHIMEDMAPFALGESGARATLGPLQLRSRALGRRIAQFDMTLFMVETPTGLVATLEYSTDLFSPQTAARYAQHFSRLLKAVTAHPLKPMDRMSLLSEEERELLVVDWNQTASNFPQEANIPHQFQQISRRFPKATALVYGNESLSYASLDAGSNQLAHYLRVQGVGPDVIVGIFAEPSPTMVLGILAILKAGGAYLPLDASHPHGRLAMMLEQSGSHILLSQGPVPFEGVHNIRLEQGSPQKAEIDKQPTTAPPLQVSSQNLAYVIFTSGSTGKPKGSAISHANVLRLVFNTNYLSFRAGDRMAQISNASFDAATFELWGALLHGGQLIGVPRNVAISPNLLANFLKDQKLDLMFITSALFNQVVKERPEAFATMRVVLVGGDAVDPMSARAVLAAGPPENLHNGYGPTESTTFALFHPIKKVAAESRTVPIGTPLSNTRALVLDSGMNPLPWGLPGELHLGGQGLARGYINAPALTAERFVPDPTGEKGSRLYKTGDLTHLVEDERGKPIIEYLGRMDHQVKIRGFRIELGEIEVDLRQHEMVNDALVSVVSDPMGGKRLAAWAAVGDALVKPSDLKQFLAQKLPEFMTPQAIMVLDRFPLTPNGKIDRKALPAPPRTNQHAAPPRYDKEKIKSYIFSNGL